MHIRTSFEVSATWAAGNSQAVRRHQTTTPHREVTTRGDL
jgi:hypothetical protein